MSNKSAVKRVEGSILNKTVATELEVERANCNFDQYELSLMFNDKHT